MSFVPDAEPRVTIVMTARERHSLAESAIEAVVGQTRRPYRFMYVDVDSPAWLREVFAARAKAWDLEVVRIDEPLWPQQARARLLDTIRTEYTVFVDNDVEVERGWLESLVACADATGAGIVGPLYLTGGGTQPARIHMAGGRLQESGGPGARILEEAHVLANEDPGRVADQLQRKACDFVEYHCMLIRTELLWANVLDPNIRCVHEHIDTSFSARRLGYATYVEPSARVTYLAHCDYMLDELHLFRDRWAQAEADASIATFCSKWDVIDDARSFAGVRRFVVDHVSQVDPIRLGLRDHAEHDREMTARELRQTRSELLDLAHDRGYTRNELATIANAYHLAHILMDGGYRPCGRPFINHVVGTASVLVRYGFRSEVVAVGLLHSAYTHCPHHPAGVREAAKAVLCSARRARQSARTRRPRLHGTRIGGAKRLRPVDALGPRSRDSDGCRRQRARYVLERRDPLHRTNGSDRPWHNAVDRARVRRARRGRPLPLAESRAGTRSAGAERFHDLGALQLPNRSGQEKRRGHGVECDRRAAMMRHPVRCLSADARGTPLAATWSRQ